MKPEVEYEVVWNGGELLPPRPTKPDDTWTPPRRLYNRKENPVLRQCQCGRIVTEGHPQWCENCETFTHPVYVPVKKDGKNG